MLKFYFGLEAHLIFILGGKICDIHILNQPDELQD